MGLLSSRLPVTPASALVFTSGIPESDEYRRRRTSVIRTAGCSRAPFLLGPLLTYGTLQSLPRQGMHASMPLATRVICPLPARPHNGSRLTSKIAHSVMLVRAIRFLQTIFILLNCRLTSQLRLSITSTIRHRQAGPFAH